MVEWINTPLSLMLKLKKHMASIVESLIEKGSIKSPADIYYLTLEQMGSLWQKGDTAAKKLLAAIEASKEQDVSRLIYALGIRQVGDKAAKGLASHFGSMDAIVAATEEELTAIDDFAKKGETDPMFKKLAELCAPNNGLWCPEAERYLLKTKGGM